MKEEMTQQERWCKGLETSITVDPRMRFGLKTEWTKRFQIKLTRREIEMEGSWGTSHLVWPWLGRRKVLAAAVDEGDEVERDGGGWFCIKSKRGIAVKVNGRKWKGMGKILNTSSLAFL